MARVVLAEAAVSNREIYGRWQVEERVDGSTRKVKARCLDCDTLYEVDLFELRRTDRGHPRRCKRCNNQIIIANNKLPPGEALVRNQLHEYKKAARKRGVSWNLPE